MRSTYLVWANKDNPIFGFVFTKPVKTIRINNVDVERVKRKLRKYGYDISKLELGVDWKVFYKQAQREEINRKAREKYAREKHETHSLIAMPPVVSPNKWEHQILNTLEQGHPLTKENGFERIVNRLVKLLKRK